MNFAISGNGQLEPLYCFAVSAKRYALYNLDSNGMPIIRKASAHGLGHLRPPYDKTNPIEDMPEPQINLRKAGLSRWQHDLWIKIIEGGKSAKPLQVDLDYHPALQLPAIGRYSATSPHLLRWFGRHNESRAYVNQVKPFGFLTALTGNSFDTGAEIILKPSKRRPRKGAIKPIAPFTTDPATAGQTAFDRNTGEPVRISKLKSYAASIRQYHLQPENKFLNGNWIESGKTMRRHVMAIRAVHIGKEANELEEQVTLGHDPEAQPMYGFCPDDIAQLQAEVKRLCGVFSKHQLAEFTEVTAARITDFIGAKSDSHFAADNAIAMNSIRSQFAKIEIEQRVQFDQMREIIVRNGLRQTARSLGLDASNLRRSLI